MEHFQKYVIVDVDGTLAITDHRQHYIKGREPRFKEWERFFLEAENDLPNEVVIELTQLYWEAGYKIIIMTGRPESIRSLTVDWLDKYQVPYKEIWMRADNDRRPDFLVKQEMVESFIAEKECGIEDIKVILEDRVPVIQMFRDMGFTVFQVAKDSF